ncbi:MAG: ABC transporter permease [Caldilineaceae bacterium]
MSLWRYALRRTLLLMPVLLGITVVAFALTHVVPRNPVYALVGTFADQKLVDETIKRYGLDQPLPVQYVRYMGGLLQGDLGTSIRSGRPVIDEIRTRLPATLELTTLALLLSLLVALILGTVAALNNRRAADVTAQLLALVGNSLPEFWLGLIFVFVFYFQLGWAPPPIGRIAGGVTPPAAITNFYLIDALVTADEAALLGAGADRAARAHPRLRGDGADHAHRARQRAGSAQRALRPLRPRTWTQPPSPAGDLRAAQRAALGGDAGGDHLRLLAGRRRVSKRSSRGRGWASGRPTPSSPKTTRWCRRSCYWPRPSTCSSTWPRTCCWR